VMVVYDPQRVATLHAQGLWEAHDPTQGCARVTTAAPVTRTRQYPHPAGAASRPARARPRRYAPRQCGAANGHYPTALDIRSSRPLIPLPRLDHSRTAHEPSRLLWLDWDGE
jgi:hypothetical protein